MPATISRGRGRRTINEINMVPFIDVMLVLLIIFMVTAPMLTPGMIDVPSVGKANKAPPKVAQLTVEADGKLKFHVKADGLTRTGTVREITDAVHQWQQQGTGDAPVIIVADKTVQYEAVVKAMDTLQKAGVKRVGLSVKQGG